VEKMVQHPNQPGFEATDLQQGHEGLPVPQALAVEPLEEGVDLLRLRGHLPGLQDIASLGAERDGDLPGVLVDSEIYIVGSPLGKRGTYFTLPKGRTASS